MAEHEKRSHRRILPKISRKAGIIILSVILLLVAVRIALPYVLKDIINHKINRVPGYAGHVNDVDLRILKGAYAIKGIQLTQTSETKPVPFFSADEIEISVEWRALFHGALVSSITILHPQMEFLAEKPQRTGEKLKADTANWQHNIKDLFPLRIDDFTILNGDVHFRSVNSKPPVDVYFQDFNVIATNLTNSAKISESMVSHVDVNGIVMGDGKIKTHLDIDPFAKQPTFNMNAEITNIDLPKLNNFLRAYGKFDVERGRFSLYVQCAASHGKFDGYLKPLLSDLKVVNWEKDKEDPAKLIWKSIVGAIADLFTNKKVDRLATRIPFSGSFKNPSPDIWATIVNLLRNAFVQAITPGLDRGAGVQAGK